MIEAAGLARRYGEFTAVEGISFSIADGEILGMLGPNGAGKTTTIRMITGFLPPTAGQVTINGHDLFREPNRARREIGYLPENVALYPEMRVSEYLGYRTKLEGMPRQDAKGAIEETVDRCLLGEVRNQIIGTLSKGYRQRVGLAAAILHGPRVLVLDEPTVGLDPKQIIAIRELIRELGRERTLLLSTHILSEVEQLCARVLIIDRGRIVAEGTPSELRAQSQGHTAVQVTLKGTVEAAESGLRALDGVLDVTTLDAGGGDSSYRLEAEPGADLREDVFRTAVASDWTLLELVEQRVSLEDVFVRLTNRDARGDESEPDVTNADDSARGSGEAHGGEPGEASGRANSEENAS